MSLFRQAAFFTSAVSLNGLPQADGGEIVFAGRSNAGKSSAINALTRRRSLAYVAKRPGRTQQINFFSLGENRYLVDLPGYGYAKVPEALRKSWQILISEYFLTRYSLLGLVFIIDARHPLTPLDWQMLDWFKPTEKPVLILLSKSDKLTKQEARRTLSEVNHLLAKFHPHCSAQLFSSTKKIGVEEAEGTLALWFKESANHKTRK
ncbi:MAG: ribosome biogenesis GTP-binding protein YihA/YsxC [Burkholderiales bacterium]